MLDTGLRATRTAALTLALAACLSLVPVHGQRTPLSAGSPASQPAAAATASPAQAATAQDKAGTAIPGEFRGIKLGMGLAEVQAALEKDDAFAYRGPDDVSLLPSKNQSLVEASGTGFVRRAFFQFLDGKLWTIIVFLDPERLDHYSVYTTLVSKYGEPGSLGPKEARWEDSSRRMSLERPLTLRYMDMKVFNSLAAGGEAKAGLEELERMDFLGGL